MLFRPCDSPFFFAVDGEQELMEVFVLLPEIDIRRCQLHHPVWPVAGGDANECLFRLLLFSVSIE
jgi:hypothetical protein